ncbi:hypothetical protein HOLleu_04515 [Holothuria leucospilota]|uniref:Mutator-like transposase domain-containing protein n=1 Tax=Holothuria leucospilota TaxID=206669 RepID=A0A9Q1CU79_HOLLE|nr:hypothetical protein HOLleu_04515 [Holothuria leucospilota]
MPRKGKKRRFKGTNYWDTVKNVSAGDTGLSVSTSSTTTETTAVNTSAIVTGPNVTDINKESQLVKEDQDEMESGESVLKIRKKASEKKLRDISHGNVAVPGSGETNTASPVTGEDRDEILKEDGNFKRLISVLSAGTLTIKEDIEKRCGFSSLLFFECSICSQKTYLKTSKCKSDSSGSTWQSSDTTDINKRTHLAATEIGIGRAGINTMANIINMPQTVTNKAWNGYTISALTAAKEEVDQVLADARQRAKDCWKSNNQGEQSEDVEVVDFPVSFDGTWSKRGFTANYGVGFVMSLDTGEVLDYSLKTKYCHQCASQKLPKESEEYKLWYKKHESSCQKNFEGSSSAMERECAKDMWKRSLDFDIRYKNMICDGDSKAFSDVWNVYGVCEQCSTYEEMSKQSKAYKDWVDSADYTKWKEEHESRVVKCNRVEKLDCVGHVQKRMGKALRDLKKKGWQIGRWEGNWWPRS